VLLDDVLAALDVHTVQWVVDKCLSGSLLRGRTVVLVSHNLAAVGGLANRVISLSAHGVASVIASTAEVTGDASVAQQASREDADKPLDMIDEPNAPIVGKARASGKLITEEEVAFGHVSFSASEIIIVLPRKRVHFTHVVLVLLYFKSMGGFIFLLVYLITDSLTNSVDL
jgi:ABC-type multidrug transport system ATPase subunit